jgi:hypothetical protein
MPQQLRAGIGAGSMAGLALGSWREIAADAPRRGAAGEAAGNNELTYSERN